MTFPDAPRTGFLITPLMAAALTLVLLANGPAVVQAQETITIRGTVVAGTRDAVLPPEIPVLLLISNPAGGLVATSQTTTGPDGRFQLDQIPRTEDGIYALSVDYAGVFYSTSLTLQDLSNDVRLTVYESTQDASVVRVIRPNPGHRQRGRKKPGDLGVGVRAPDQHQRPHAPARPEQPGDFKLSTLRAATSGQRA